MNKCELLTWDTPAKAGKVKKGELKMQRRNVKFEKISMIQNIAVLQLLNFDNKHYSDELLASCVRASKFT